MKTPIAVTVAILASGAGLGWNAHHRLATLRLTHEQLLATAAQLGIGFDPAHPGEPLNLAKRGRQSREFGEHLAAADFIALARDKISL